MQIAFFQLFMRDSRLGLPSKKGPVRNEKGRSAQLNSPSASSIPLFPLPRDRHSYVKLS